MDAECEDRRGSSVGAGPTQSADRRTCWQKHSLPSEYTSLDVPHAPQRLLRVKVTFNAFYYSELLLYTAPLLLTLCWGVLFNGIQDQPHRSEAITEV